MLGIGIDIGGTNTKLVVVNKAGKALAHERFKTEADKGPASFIKRLGAAVDGLRRDYGRQLVSVGIGAAGDVDPERGVLRFAPNLGWRNVKLTAPLEKLTGLPCAMENDANMAAWGAYEIELKRKLDDVLTLTLGTGIGSGMVIDGKLYHGSSGCAGEAGHMKIVPDGRLCGCGGKGCLEAYCGSGAIMRRARELVKNPGGGSRRPRRAQGLGRDRPLPRHGSGRPDTVDQPRLRGPDRRCVQGQEMVPALHAGSAERPADKDPLRQGEGEDLRRRRPGLPRGGPVRPGAGTEIRLYSK